MNCCTNIFCYPLYSERQTCGRTSQGHTGKSHRISPPSFCGACLNYYREKDSFSPPFPSSTVKSNFVHPRNNRSRLLDLFGTMRGKISVRVIAPRFELTSQRQKVSRLQLNHRGRPANAEYTNQKQSKSTVHYILVVTLQTVVPQWYLFFGIYEFESQRFSPVLYSSRSGGIVETGGREIEPLVDEM